MGKRQNVGTTTYYHRLLHSTPAYAKTQQAILHTVIVRSRMAEI